MSPQRSGSVAAYGQACRNCFKSKCKCIARAEGNACERCHRLHKECVPSDSVRQRNAVKEAHSAARIAQLESKLDTLVSLLQPADHSSQPSINPCDIPEEQIPISHDRQRSQEAGRPTPRSTPAALSGTINASNVDRSHTGDTLHPALTPASTNGSIPISRLSTDEVETLLRVFRDTMLPSFPFVHIHLTMTADQLRRERPFFLQAIIAVASPTIEQKLVHGTALKQYLARNMLGDDRSDIDLLLGLLTYIAWGFDHFLNKTASRFRFIHLAMSVVYDLRLNRSESQEVEKVSFYNSQGVSEHNGEATFSPPLEKERAVLGCFYLSAIISSCLGQLDTMRWTSRMEECLVLIEAAEECPNIEVFAAQVRLQLFAQRIAEVRESCSLNHSGTSETARTTAFPGLLHLKTIQAQLLEYRLSLSVNLQRHDLVRLHLLYTDLLICEAAHPPSSGAPLVPPHTKTVVPNHPAGFQPLECYWQSVMDIKSYFEVFLALSPSVCRGLAFPMWIQMLRCIMILYRLSAHPDPTWDCQAVRKTVDLVHVLQDLVQLTQRAGVEAGEQSEHDLFSRFARFLHSLQDLVHTTSRQRDSASETTWPYPEDFIPSHPNVNAASNESLGQLGSMDLGDNIWVGNIFGWS